MNKSLPNRQSIRLKEFDYSTNGAYFVTICSYNRQPLLKDFSLEIKKELKQISFDFQGVTLEDYAILNDHLHLLLFLEGSKVSLSRVIQSFKSKAWHRIRENHNCFAKVWQRNYFEHIIRNQKAYERFKLYILRNPEKEILISEGYPTW